MCNVLVIRLLWKIGILTALAVPVLILLRVLPGVLVWFSVVSLILAILHLLSFFVSARLVYYYSAHLSWANSINFVRCFVVFAAWILTHVAVLASLKYFDIFALAGEELLVNVLLTRCLAEIFARKFNSGTRKINKIDLDCLNNLGIMMGFQVRNSGTSMIRIIS